MVEIRTPVEYKIENILKIPDNNDSYTLNLKGRENIHKLIPINTDELHLILQCTSSHSINETTGRFLIDNEISCLSGRIINTSNVFIE